MKIGYCSDWFGQATTKVAIIAETISGKYVVRHMPTEMASIHGTKYLAEPLTGLILKDKSEVTDIKEEI